MKDGRFRLVLDLAEIPLERVDGLRHPDISAVIAADDGLPLQVGDKETGERHGRRVGQLWYSAAQQRRYGFLYDFMTIPHRERCTYGTCTYGKPASISIGIESYRGNNNPLVVKMKTCSCVGIPS